MSTVSLDNLAEHLFRFNPKNIVAGSYLINLKRRTDRREKALVSLKDVPNLKVFEAIDGRAYETISDMLITHVGNDKLNSYLQEEMRLSNADQRNNRFKAKTGCYLSHWLVWKEIAEDPVTAEDQYFLVMEDDITTCYSHSAMKLRILNSNPTADLIMVSNRMGISTHATKMAGNYGTDGYLIKKSACKKLIKDIRLDNEAPYMVAFSLDNMLADYSRITNNLSMDAMKLPYIFCTNTFVNNDSDIEVA